MTSDPKLTGSEEGYRLFFEPQAERDLRGPERVDRQRIDAKIAALAADPRPFGVEKLLESTFRIRVGDWRIIYLVDDAQRVIIISRVKRRNERTYR